MTAANADQHLAWNGESGERWVSTTDWRDAFLAPIADLLLVSAAIASGERVLDLGCGCGATTLAAATASGAAGHVAGVDLSAPMLEVARQRCRDASQVELRQADIQTDPLGGPFDVAISRFGTMFFDDPGAAFANIARHLEPGARLCLATWQPLAANPWLVVPVTALRQFATIPEAAEPAASTMFAQSEPAAMERLLTGAGLDAITTERHSLALCAGQALDDAVEHLVGGGPARATLELIPFERHEEALTAVGDALLPYHDPERGILLGAGVLLTTAIRRSAT